MGGAIRAGQSGHHDIHYSLAGTWGWCAGGPSGHRRWRSSGAGHGLFLAHGPAPGARNFAFHIVAAHRTRSFARILEAGPGGLACRDLVRSGNALWRLRREFDCVTHTLPELARTRSEERRVGKEWNAW